MQGDFLQNIQESPGRPSFPANSRQPSSALAVVLLATDLVDPWGRIVTGGDGRLLPGLNSWDRCEVCKLKKRVILEDDLL